LSKRRGASTWKEGGLYKGGRLFSEEKSIELLIKGGRFLEEIPREFLSLERGIDGKICFAAVRRDQMLGMPQQHSASRTHSVV